MILSLGGDACDLQHDNNIIIKFNFNSNPAIAEDRVVPGG